MNKENLTEILEFESEILDEGSLTVPAEKLMELKKAGFVKVEVTLRGSAKNAAKIIEPNEKIFSKIMEVQRLSEKCAFDLISVRGGIKRKNFGRE